MAEDPKPPEKRRSFLEQLHEALGPSVRPVPLPGPVVRGPLDLLRLPARAAEEKAALRRGGLSPDDPWYATTWEGARAFQERRWQALSEEDKKLDVQQRLEEDVALWASHGCDISHILAAPHPATPAARAAGCICPDPRPGELHMLPECPLHHYPLGFRPPGPGDE